jgi:acylglycerol lipase
MAYYVNFLTVYRPFRCKVANPMSTYEESWLAGPQSTQFYSRTYKATSPKAILVFVHGFIEHVARYEHVHSVWATRGITVFTYDQRGFGRTATDDKLKSKSSSYGKTSRKEQLADIEWAIKHAKSEFGDLPLFLMGHSMVRARLLSPGNQQ